MRLGAAVALSKDGKVVGAAISDAFGEFKIDMIEPNSGEYDVNAKVDDRKSTTHKVQLGQSQYIGVIEL